METQPKLNDFTRQELEEHYDVLKAEYQELKLENEKLRQAILYITELAEQNSIIADNYRSLFKKLYMLIKDKYDKKSSKQKFS